MVSTTKKIDNIFLFLKLKIEFSKILENGAEAEYLITIAFSKYEMNFNRGGTIVFGIDGGELTLDLENCKLLRKKNDPYLQGLKPIVIEKSSVKNLKASTFSITIGKENISKQKIEMPVVIRKTEEPRWIFKNIDRYDYETNCHDEKFGTFKIKNGKGNILSKFIIKKTNIKVVEFKNIWDKFNPFLTKKSAINEISESLQSHSGMRNMYCLYDGNISYNLSKIGKLEWNITESTGDTSEIFKKNEANWKGIEKALNDIEEQKPRSFDEFSELLKVRPLEYMNLKPEQTMKLTPLMDRYLIKPIASETDAKVGIIIPDAAKKMPVEGKIVAVGNGNIGKKRKLGFLDAKEGDIILYGKYSGTNIKLNGDDYLIMRENDLLKKLTKID